MTVKFVYNITNQNTLDILHLENEKMGMMLEHGPRME